MSTILGAEGLTAPGNAAPAPELQVFGASAGTVSGSGTISTSVVGPFVLFANDDPLTVTATGTVTSTTISPTGAVADGIDGIGGANWTVVNDGTVTSSSAIGISLDGIGDAVRNDGLVAGVTGVELGGGLVSNGATAGTAASISGTVIGVDIYGGGTLTNAGHVSGSTYGVSFAAGGTVTNDAGALISSGEFGVRIQGGSERADERRQHHHGSGSWSAR